ncbi:MAG: AI-2E family transporter [Nanoarchaeota archaeon]|nr:AI-2E family transporter [Nanoarchaeota archaeon]MBU4308858.1 AI-2E family transporter [Nanoarchaeota archaeon]
MKDPYLQKIITVAVLFVLVVLTFFLLKPILLSIITGVILAFILSPVYNWFLKKTKGKNLAAGIVCVFLILLIILPLIFLTPLFINQAVKIYVSSQQMNFVEPLEKIFPSLFVSEEFSAQIGSSIYSFVTKITTSLVNSLSTLIMNSPIIFLHLFVVFFTFYFVLRDGKSLENYLRSLMPFSKQVEEKLFEYSKGITTSVLYGQIIVGLVQGVIIGTGFFISKVPSALILTLLAVAAGIFPIIGTAIIWLPVLIYFLIAGNTLSAIIVLIFGVISSNIDGFIRPFFVSKKVNLHPALILVSMVGGLFVFGILGFILGPLIVSYLIIFLEAYRKNMFPD